MKKLICIICLCVGLLGVALPVTLASGAEDEGCVSAKSVARTEIWKAITSGAAGSASVAIMERGKLVYAEGFGMADREKSIPVDKNTLFNIGSISKVHCTTAILLLVDEGKISLDQPVIAYLPELTMADERYKEISVRMLLNHSSGLPGTVGPNSFGFAYHTEFYKDVLEILAQSKLKHRPGEMAIYCNDGFTLAEIIVARVSGETYPAFLARRIIKPLALTNTGLGVGQRPATATIAKYYTSDGKAEPPEVVSLLGSGGLAATPEDLCKFADSFSAEGHSLLSPRELSESKTEQPTAFSDKLKGLRLTYGLGWDFANVRPYKEQGITVLGKTGGTGNYTSMLYVVPDKRISVAVLATGAHSGAAEIADAVLAAYLIERGLLAKKDQPQQPPLKALPAPLELKEYEGYYCDGNELVRMEIDLEKGLLKRYALEGSTETALPAIVYNGGQFHKENNAVYFTTVEGKRYFLQRSAIFGVDMVAGQRVEGAAEPKQLNVVVDGKQWLRRNVKAYEGTMGLTGHVITSRLVQPCRVTSILAALN